MPNLNVLNVAEKNDAAKRLSQIMSGGNSQRREGFSKFNKIYEFDYNILNSNCKMIMTSVSGHLMQHEFVQGYKNWTSCRPLALFDAPVNTFVPDQFFEIKRTLVRESRKCSVLIIWTDGDREGENIGFEIIKVCREIKPNIRLYRAKFSEITPRAVNLAAQNLVPPDENVSNAVEVRSELDLRIGAAFTRFQTLRLQKRFPNFLAQQVISYGSCQFPTLGFVVERYKQVQEFIPETFYKIKVSHRKDDTTADFSWKRGRLFNQRVCSIFCAICQENPTALVVNVISKPKSKWRPVPLDTVELEKTASKKLKINAKTTMGIAEKLYSKGIISYPRTETNIFPKGMDLVGLVQNQTQDNQWGDFAQRILDDGGPNPRQGKKTDNAHPPIHPIKFTNNLQGDEKKVYDFIVRHFLACVSKDAQGQETTVEVEIAEEHFFAHGLMILARNYLEVYIYEGWNSKNIPNYSQGDSFVPDSIDMVNGETQAPPLLSESDLIALMEKHGIGTDATHADHIEKIKDRQYVGVQNDGTFLPGKLGMGLVEGYDSMGFAMSKPHLRAGLESDLKLICEGRKNKDVVLADQVRNYKEVFEQAMVQVEKLDNAMSSYFGVMSDVPVEDVGGSVSDPIRKCPRCNQGDMTLRKRKEGDWLLGCMNYPDCKNSMFFPSLVTDVQRSDAICSQCKPLPVHKLIFVFKRGSVPPMMMSPYTSCIGGCDDMLLGLLDSRGKSNTSTVQSSNNTTTNSRNNQRSQQNARNNLPTVANPNRGKTNSRKDGKTNKREPQTKTKKNNSTQKDTGLALRNDGNSSSFNNGGNNSSGSSSGSGGICCECGVPAIQLVTRKAGPNQNRPFFKCGSSTHACNFFVWGDAADNTATTSAPTPLRTSSSMNNTTIDYSVNNINTNNNNFSRQNVPQFSNNTIPPDNGDDVKCKCNIPAASRTVSKDGPNKGRPFYGCMKPREESCGFFQWGDQANLQVGASNSSRSNMFDGFDNSFGPVGGGGSNNNTDEFSCMCGNPAVLRTVFKDGPNKGRQFYACSKPMGQSCKFFQWTDEPATGSSNGNNLSSNNSFGNNGNNNNSRNNSFGQNSRQNSYNSGNNSSSSSTDVACGCGTPAPLLTVRKDGPNQGRQFYGCAKPRNEGCGFFQWSDDSGGGGGGFDGGRGGGGGFNGSGDGGGTKSRKRKCGQCGVLGHDKRSCPQNR